MHINRYFLKCLYIIPYSLLITYSCVVQIGKQKDIYIDNIISIILSCGTKPEFSSIVNIFLFIFPLLFFQFIISGYFCNDICKEGIYGFTRNKSKLAWYLNKTLGLYLSSSIFYFVFIIFQILILLVNGYSFNNYFITFTWLLQYYFILVTISCTIALSLNILSIKIGNHIAYLVLIVLILVTFMIAFISNQYYDKNIFMKCLFDLNIFSNYIVNWHYINYPISKIIVSLSNSKKLSLSFSMYYSSLLLFVVILFGWVFIKKTDILSDDKESE